METRSAPVTGKSAHDIESEEARRSGDPARIRQLYHSYGHELLEAFADRETDVTQHGSQSVADWQAEHLVGLAVSGPVLDIGCGPRPEISLRLGHEGRRVVCTDLSMGLVKLARTVAAQEGLRDVHFLVCDAEALPFRAGVFGLVVSDDVIEHVPDPAKMTEECARVVAADGLVSVSTPNGRALSVWVDKLKDIVRRGRLGPPERYYLVPSHLREFTRSELKQIFNRFFGRTACVAVGWDGDGAVKKIVSRVTTKPPLRGICRHWIVVAGRPAGAGR